MQQWWSNFQCVAGIRTIHMSLRAHTASCQVCFIFILPLIGCKYFFGSFRAIRLGGMCPDDMNTHRPYCFIHLTILLKAFVPDMGILMILDRMANQSSFMNLVVMYKLLRSKLASRNRSSDHLLDQDRRCGQTAFQHFIAQTFLDFLLSSCRWQWSSGGWAV